MSRIQQHHTNSPLQGDIQTRAEKPPQPPQKSRGVTAHSGGGSVSRMHSAHAQRELQHVKKKKKLAANEVEMFLFYF